MAVTGKIFQRIGITSMAVAVGLALTVAPSANAVQPTKGAPQTINGTGDSVPLVSPIDEPVIITLTHDGTSNFIVKPIGKDGEEGFSWTNEIGAYNGTIFQEMGGIFAPYSKKNPIVAVSVMADGNWNIQINKLSSAAGQPLKQGQGAGDNVIRFNQNVKGFKRITFTHDGTSNFIVRPITAKGEEGISLVNEIGNYKGTVRLPAGTKYLYVIADGAWTYSTK